MELYVRTRQRAAGSNRRTSRSIAWANAQAFPIDDANCRNSIRDDPKMILGSYVKRALIISFVERGIERLGRGHRTVVWGGFGQ